MGAQPKVLYFDIEVTPAIAYIYPPYYDAKFVREIEPQSIMSISYAWEHEKKVHFLSLPDFFSLKQIRDGVSNDKKLVEKFREIINIADVIVGHNSDNFDIKHVNTRLMYWGIEQTKFYEQADTLKLARRTVKLASYKLDYICDYFNLGRKEGSHGSLWFDCMQGDKKAWKKMKKYNDQDVILTKKLYNKLNLYAKSIINTGKYVSEGDLNCPNCASNNYVAKGLRATVTRFKRSYKCKDCGRRFQGTKSFKTRDEALLSPIGI